MRKKIEVINNELILTLDNDIKDMYELTWGVLFKLDLFTYDELILITMLNGDNIDTLNNALFVRYGCHDIEHFLESEYNINIYDEELENESKN